MMWKELMMSDVNIPALIAKAKALELTPDDRTDYGEQYRRFIYEMRVALEAVTVDRDEYVRLWSQAANSVIRLQAELEAVTVPTESDALAAADARYPTIDAHLTPTERTLRMVKKETFALGFLAAGFRLPAPVEPVTTPTEADGVYYCPIHGDLLAAPRSARCASASDGHEFRRTSQPVQVTEAQVEAIAHTYWLASERDVFPEGVDWDWGDDERERFLWATRTVLEAAAAVTPVSGDTK